MAYQKGKPADGEYKDCYERITHTLIGLMEKGVRPWHKPWNAEHAAGKITRPLRHNGEPYNGINILNLWMAAQINGWENPYSMTFKQAQELGGHVRKGEKGTLVVYANKVVKSETDKETGEDVEKVIPFLKGFTVFNAEQIDGLPAHFYAKAEPPTLTLAQRMEHAEIFFKNTGADIRHGGNRAYNSVSGNFIQMPPFEFFKTPETYYSTLAHESNHWTRHPSRLNRDFGQKRFGDNAYAMEELVAELGSAFLGADLGIAPAVMEDHAAYLDNWLTVLKKDKYAIFTAASHAQKSVEYLHSFQPPAPILKPLRPENDNHMAQEQPRPQQHIVA